MDAETRGERAAQILDNEVYQEAVAGAKQRIQNQWASSATDANTREALWHKMQAIDAVTQELAIIRDNGIVERTKREKETERG